MEALHIEEDIYRQIAEYIEDNALPYIRGWHSEADEFRIADVCFETDSAPMVTSLCLLRVMV